MPTVDAIERKVPFTTEDGLDLHLVNITPAGGVTRGPVVLVHGAGVRGNLFRPPTGRNIVDVLLEEGYDVWLENWRASIDVEPTDWDLDQATLYDHPAAVQTIVRETGAETVKAIIHCQGAVTFAMSAVAGLVPEVDTIVANAVSLHPMVPVWSRLKMRYAIPVGGLVMDSLDPGRGDDPADFPAKLLTGFVKLTHRECDATACRMVSFSYGAGFPALWRHENINDEVHEEWIPQEFGRAPMSFFRHMGECIRAGHAVSHDTSGRLPVDYTLSAPKTDARFSFFTGWRNRCFLPESQIKTHSWFEQWRPGYHTLHVLRPYGHLDVFIGDNAARDVFPLMLAELERGPS